MPIKLCVMIEGQEGLTRHCRAVGRDPSQIRRSLMIPYIVGRDIRERDARLANARRIFPRVPESEAAWRAAGFLFGPPGELVEELRAWENLGITRVMLQTLDMDDVAAIELLAREVVPACR
jgi:alkanesulfonate monooxygenase SsuD/methylene tetrahydromethanopterin reductase-like flavin-dependent oxidoreductase (luciferase family)